MWSKIPIFVSCLAICSSSKVVLYSLEKDTSLNTRDAGSLNIDKNGYYLLELEVGSQGQKVKVVADTGSSNFWISDQVYNASASPSWQAYRRDLPLSYGAFSGQFDLGYDWLEFGGHRYNATVGSGYNLAGTIVPTGILGLAYSYEDATADFSDLTDIKGGYDTLPYILKKNGQTASVAYSLWLSNDKVTGELLFGGVDHSRYTGKLQRVPIVVTYALNPVTLHNAQSTKPTYLSIALNRISLNTPQVSGDVVSGANFPVMLDSGNPWLTLSTDIAFAISRSLGLGPFNPVFTEKPEGTITFEFSGVEIEFPLANLVEEQEGGGGYTLPIKGNIDPQVSLEYGSLYIIGTPFLRNAYVAFDLDNNEIALAPVVHTPGAPQVEELSTGIPGDKAERYSSTSLNTNYTLKTLTSKTTSSV